MLTPDFRIADLTEELYELESYEYEQNTEHRMQ
jgi:hypothetical protein